MDAITASTFSIDRMGLGLAALGRPGYINLGHAGDLNREYEVAAMERRAFEVLDAAYTAGVRYFDAARSYGRAEEFLGSWLGARRPEGVFVASKWGYTYTAEWKLQAEKHEVKDHSPAALERQWPESREILGDFLDLYQIHSAVPETGVLANESVLAGLARIKSTGVRIGLSVSGPLQADTIRAAMESRVDGVPLFDAVQATYNCFERAAEDALREAHESGMRVIVKEGLANGRLTERNEIAADARALGPVREQAGRLGASMDAFALGFVLSRPYVDVVLSGAATVAHLRSNLDAVNVEWDNEAQEALESAIQTSPGYWRVRSELPWG